MVSLLTESALQCGIAGLIVILCMNVTATGTVNSDFTVLSRVTLLLALKTPHQ